MIVPILLFVQVFLLPGLVVYFNREKEMVRLITKIIVSSISISIFSFSTVLLLRNMIDSNLLIFSLIFSIIISLLLRYLIRKDKEKISSKNIKFSLWFFLLFVICFTVNIALFFHHKSIVGADIGRFGIISHALFLKGKFETDLTPYDMAKDFFYFPGTILLSPLFEIVGINPIAFLSFLTFFFSSLYGLPVYLITKKLFNDDIAISSFLFSSFLFNPVINIGFFGVFPYAIAIFFLLSFIYFFLENEKDSLILYSCLIDVVCFHAYLLILLFPFLIAAVILKWSLFSFLFEKKFWKFSPIFLLFLFPYFLKTHGGLFIPFEWEKKLDIFMFSTFNRNLSLEKVIQYILFSSPVGFNFSIFLVVGLILFIFSMIRYHKNFKFGTQFLTLSFLLSFVMLFVLFNDMNFARSIWINWFFYSIGFGLIFSDKILNLFILFLIALTTLSPSVFSYFNLYPTYNQGQIPWIVWNSFYDAINFIKHNTQLNSTFLIDGGGAGCTGASASYGERIFPLTSRKIFYFSDYCWANYDKEEYRKRVELYRKISINPNNLEIINMLKQKYGITHIFIGPTDVGLNKNLFNNSTFYKLIYENKDFRIFKIL